MSVEWPPSVWHGVIDPNGEPVSPVRCGTSRVADVEQEIQEMQEVREMQKEMLEL